MSDKSSVMCHGFRLTQKVFFAIRKRKNSIDPNHGMSLQNYTSSVDPLLLLLLVVAQLGKLAYHFVVSYNVTFGPFDHCICSSWCLDREFLLLKFCTESKWHFKHFDKTQLRMVFAFSLLLSHYLTEALGFSSLTGLHVVSLGQRSNVRKPLWSTFYAMLDFCCDSKLHIYAG